MFPPGRLSEEASERLAFGTGYIDSGLVFTQEDGSPLIPLIFTQRFQRAARDAGVPRIRFHDLRHGHVTYLQRDLLPKDDPGAHGGRGVLSVGAHMTVDVASYGNARMPYALSDRRERHAGLH